MDWVDFLQQTSEIVRAAQEDIRESEASWRSNECSRMADQFGEKTRKQRRLEREKLQQHHLALRERRDLLITAPLQLPGREEGLRNLNYQIKKIKNQIRKTRLV